MVENLGLDFLERQQRHVQRKLCSYEDNQGVSPDEQTPKRSKVNLAKHRLTPSRPCTSDHNILKKRSKLPGNSIRRQSSVLEPMDTNVDSAPSPFPPPFPPRSKTYFPSSMAHSVTLSGVYGGGGQRRRSGNDPYANFDRLQKAKMMAEKAVKSKKIFSIHGPYPLIRKALRERGWVEKEFKLPLKLKGTNKPGGDSSDVDDDDDDDFADDDTPKDSGIGASPRPSFDSNENEENEPNDCYGIMGRMVRNELPTFQWTTRTSSIDWRFLQKDQMVNHYAKANFTTKVGLCMNLRMLSCFSEGHSDTFFPRCYRLSNEEDKLDFIDDFRLSAACSILKVAVARHVDNAGCHDDEKVENGQLPPPGGPNIVPVSVLQMAIRVCRRFGEERNHEDIDQDDSVLHVPEDDWDKLILHYSKLVHEGGTISQSGSYLSQCEDALSMMKERNPQFAIEGCKNTWIIKPGAKSRGRGIIVMNKLEEILKLVSGDSTLIKDSRWVVQKYIERPLLVHGTKFDVRQWFLVSDWNPVTVWIYKESYLRFSSRPFTLKNLEPCIHLCNYSVQKNFEVDPKRNSLLPPDNMWSDTDFKNHLRNRGCLTLWEDRVFPGMKKAIVHICQTAQDTVEYRKSSFELYGADFMIDEDYNPWLIEVNSSPTMSRSTSVTSKLCASVQEDTLKVILDRKRDRNCDVGLFELMYKQATVDVPLYVGKALNVDGVTIKKPSVPARRPICPVSSPYSNANNKTNSTTNESTPLVAKSLGRTAGVYSQVANKPTKPRIKPAAPGNVTQSVRPHQERAKTPVKIKMQTTMKRLTNEVNNTPSKPNAFNLPKCLATSANTNQTSSASQTTGAKPQSRITVKANGSLYKLPSNDDVQPQPPSSSMSHFVSSPQAKAASSMGIMSLGSAYSSIVAAANRGCLPSKVNHPYPPPQPVVPKNFPASGVPGGEVFAGGSAIIHPSPPPGVVALSPQTIGLSLPFQKYYNMHVEPTTVQGGSTLHRRGVTYGIQDFRLGGSHPRVSGRLY